MVAGSLLDYDLKCMLEMHCLSEKSWGESFDINVPAEGTPFLSDQLL